MRTKAVLETFLRMWDNVITKENGGQKNDKEIFQG